MSVVQASAPAKTSRSSRARRDVAERFWEKVDKTTTSAGCWPWTGAGSRSGYGVFRLNGRQERAHRIAWLLANGPLGPDHDWLWPFFTINHTCDNPPCCNPAHLKLGTFQINSEDMVAKGRQASGERNGNAKLREADVDEIRRLYSVGDISQAALGRRFGVSHPVISFIVQGKRWQRAPLAGLEEIKKEHRPRGERQGGAKLTAANVVKICRMRQAGRTLRAIAKQMGVSEGAVLKIVRGRSWKHITQKESSR